MSNKNLNKAKKEKNNEFYTQLSDIEKELQHYEQHFKDKIVYANCDSPESNFVKYFNDNKERLEIKDFYHTWYDKTTREGSFDSDVNIELMKKADIIVTNPPFSLFRDFVSLLTEYNKQFIIIGAMGAITYKDCFKLIKDGCMWLGVSSPKEFVQPDKSIKKFGNICWFTNLEHNNRNKKLVLTKEYNSADYPKYDNYDAIECSKVKDIPKDYYKVIGVPVSFIENFNPNQFEIIGLGSGESLKEVCDTAIYPKEFLTDYFNSGKKGHLSAGMYGLALYRNGVAIAPYARILIKHKTNVN